jgi:hypothetical protein
VQQIKERSKDIHLTIVSRSNKAYVPLKVATEKPQRHAFFINKSVPSGLTYMRIHEIQTDIISWPFSKGSYP